MIRFAVVIWEVQPVHRAFRCFFNYCSTVSIRYAYGCHIAWKSSSKLACINVTTEKLSNPFYINVSYFVQIKWMQPWALSCFSDLTLSQEFQPMAAQLSMKAALPLAKILATVSCHSCKTGSLTCPETHIKPLTYQWHQCSEDTPELCHFFRMLSRRSDVGDVCKYDIVSNQVYVQVTYFFKIH